MSCRVVWIVLISGPGRAAESQVNWIYFILSAMAPYGVVFQLLALVHERTTLTPTSPVGVINSFWWWSCLVGNWLGMTVLCDMHAWAAKVHPPSSMTTKQPPFTTSESPVGVINSFWWSSSSQSRWCLVGNWLGMTVLCDMHAWAAKVHPPSSMTTKQPPFTMDEARVAISPSLRGGSSPYSSMLIRRLSLLEAARLAEQEARLAEQEVISHMTS